MDNVVLTGVVIRSAEAGEYDRRLNMITGEQGLVTVFARGARRQGSRLLSVSMPFTFGRFTVSEGRNSKRLMSAEVINYFDALKHDLSSVAYGSYILELSEYFAQENMEAGEVIRLIYQSFRALEAPSVDDRLVRRVFEIRTLINEGIYPGLEGRNCSGDLMRTLSHIETVPLEKLYTFRVSDEVLDELSDFSAGLVKRCVDRPLKSEAAIRSLLANETP